MPWKSVAQQAKMNILAKQGKVSQKMVDEGNAATKGLKLPQKVKQPKR